MKRTPAALILISLLPAFLTSCRETRKEPDPPYREGAIVLTIKGMHCSSCEGTIMTALSKTNGVEWARAENELGQVAYTGPANRTDVEKAIRGVGFEVLP